MGGSLPKPLGPLPVAFADVELSRGPGAEAAQDLPPLPLVRVYYPTSADPRSWALSQALHRRWLPSPRYAYGYLNKLVKPTVWHRRLLLSVLAGLLYVVMWPVALAAAAGVALLAPTVPGGAGPAGDGRLPVVVFSHGAWSMRTTYSVICTDLASHGY
eukprot:SM003442S12962  [mRNA]  locus=s3442:84:821:- [translate_table: standard]